MIGYSIKDCRGNPSYYRDRDGNVARGFRGFIVRVQVHRGGLSWHRESRAFGAGQLPRIRRYVRALRFHKARRLTAGGGA